MPDMKYVKFAGRMVIVGFGSIGQGVLPLFLRHHRHGAVANHHRHRRGTRP